MEPDKRHLTSILTLRYDPAIRHTLLAIEAQDVAEDAIDVTNEVKKRLDNAIAKFINAKRPRRVSLALSGGVDSILTLAMLREQFPELKIQCVTYGDGPDSFDVRTASEIARRLDADHEVMFFGNVFEELPKQISIVGQPKINYYWYVISRHARRYSDIWITGDGADELFMGYIFRYKRYLEICNSNTWVERVKAYLNCHNRDWVDDQEDMFGAAAGFSWDMIYNSLRRFFDNGLPLLQQVGLADYNGKLMCDWMPAHTKIYSALGMSGFSPFLNHDLIRYAFRIPMRQKYDSKANIGKLVLRKITSEKDIQVATSKFGLSPSITSLWESHGKGYVKQFLSEDSRIIRDKYISQKWINSALQHADGGDIRYINKLLHCIGFEVWYRIFVSGEMKSSDRL